MPTAQELAWVIFYSLIACTVAAGYATAMTVAGYEMYSARHPHTTRTEIAMIAAVGCSIFAVILGLGTYFYNHKLPTPSVYITKRPRYGYWGVVFLLVVYVVFGDAIGYWILGGLGVKGEGGPGWDSYYSFGFVGGLPLPGLVYLVGCALDLRDYIRA